MTGVRLALARCRLRRASADLDRGAQRGRTV